MCNSFWEFPPNICTEYGIKNKTIRRNERRQEKRMMKIVKQAWNELNVYLNSQSYLALNE